MVISPLLKVLIATIKVNLINVIRRCGDMVMIPIGCKIGYPPTAYNVRISANMRHYFRLGVCAIMEIVWSTWILRTAAATITRSQVKQGGYDPESK